uniref:Uncharacterized protein n=1 Tax=Caudovirales sp. ctu3532 TaxID=2827639 RepID=A0A8S5TI28_9CAUD|nr:MAG TPA: hypothetical protein [Caudovirales sp. ctu3532]
MLRACGWFVRVGRGRWLVRSADAVRPAGCVSVVVCGCGLAACSLAELWRLAALGSAVAGCRLRLCGGGACRLPVRCVLCCPAYFAHAHAVQHVRAPAACRYLRHLLRRPHCSPPWHTAPPKKRPHGSRRGGLLRAV